MRSYAQAKAILRGNHSKQAGFKAEDVEKTLLKMKLPILYQEGEAHRVQRKQLARFFTPVTTSKAYRRFMESFADELISRFEKKGRADVSELSMQLAVRVAAQVIGLTNSLVPGMDRRLNAFFAEEAAAFGWTPRKLYTFLGTQLALLSFYLFDVRPAIRTRRHEAQEDVISHLLANDYSDLEILTECVTYAAAGMATTREFISVAAWHFLENPALREDYLAKPEAERHGLLGELLRLEPVVSHLYRRATADIRLELEGGTVTIPKGDLIDLHIYAINADDAVVGDHALLACPARRLGEGAQAPVMSFGDGHHRCPGAYIAIQESDIFLQRLLALTSLRVERPPTFGWSEVAKGYEVRDFILTVRGR